MKWKMLKRITCLLLCVILLSGCIQISGNFGSFAPEKSEGAGEEAAQEEPDNSLEGMMGMLGESYPGVEGGEPILMPQHQDDFVSVKNADPGLTIQVLAPSGYSVESVLAGMKLKNLTNPILTDPNETDLIDPDRLTAEAGGGIFTVTCAGGFNPGEVYQIELTDGNLSYAGQPGVVRFYNISTAGPEALNMKLDNDVQFLNAAELNANDAGRALLLDGMFRYDASSQALQASGGSGSFNYAEGAYAAGDIVAIYEGIQPDERSFADTEQEVAYVKITGVNANGDGSAQYQYEQASDKDVLFVPDVIPVHQEEKLLLAAGTTSSVMLESSALEFTSDGEFAQMRLDENTEVEPGDYLAFYTGTPEDGEVSGYAEVLEVVRSEGEDGEDGVEISYKAVSMDEMMSCIDTYHYATLNEAQIRSAYNEDAVKAQVLNELSNNGYLMESTYNLADIALDTEEAKELFADTPLDQLTFYYGKNEENSMSGAQFQAIANGAAVNTVTVKGDPDVTVTPNIVHFAGKTGYGMGLRLEAYAKFYITIRGADALKAALKVTITFFFETEVVMGYTVDATSIWKWKWIFPYIYDYSVSGSCANGIYVGAGFSTVATLIKNEREKTEEELAAGIAWPEEVDQTPGAQKVMAFANYVKGLKDKHDSIFPPQTTGGGSLAEKYRAFILAADRSWVDLLNPNIFDWNGSIDPFHIIAFRLKLDFIVSAQLNAAIGVSANYERSYRQTFNFLLIHETSDGTQIDETELSRFRADAYIFGAIGLRAGLRLTIAAGLFDARLDSIGIEAEAGFYARFWGYFFAGVEINDVGKPSSTTDMYYSGGLNTEVGAYYTVTFVIQAGDGAISYRRPIAGDEYPFFGAGVPAVVSDFAYEQGDESKNFEAAYTKSKTEFEIPENIFTMQSMSIKDGTVNEDPRGNRNALENFIVSIDDPDFSYAYRGSKHLLVRNSRETGEGTLHITLTWKGSCFEQLSRQLTRTIEVQWENPETTISFLNLNGSVFFEHTAPMGTALTEEDLPQGEPEARGYTFLGWLDPEGEELTAMPEVMPEEDTVYTSSWFRHFVDVQVEYWYPFHDDQGRVMYYQDDTDTISNLIYPDDPVENIAEILKEHKLLRTEEDHVIEGKKWYQHYKVNTADSVLSAGSVAWDGSTTFKICLEWDAFTITFIHGDGNKTTKKVLPGMPIEFPEVTRKGFIFTGWMDESGNMVSGPVECTGDASFTAVWEMIPPTLEVEFQVRIKNWDTYWWTTLDKQTLVFDSYEVTVEQLIERMGGMPAGYELDVTATGRHLEDVVTIAEDGSTRVILRLHDLPNE